MGGGAERDLPELLHCFALPGLLWRKLRTTNVIERCFVEVRRRTRPMVVFTNVESVDRIIYATFQSVQRGREKPHPRPISTSSLTSPGRVHLLRCSVAYMLNFVARSQARLLHVGRGGWIRVRLLVGPGKQGACVVRGL